MSAPVISSSRKALGVLLALTGIYYNGAQLADAGGARQLRFLFRIDVIDLYLGRERGVAAQQIARLRELGGLAEISDLDILFQILDGLYSLIGKAELFVGSGVVRFVVAVGQNSWPPPVPPVSPRHKQ